MGFPLRDELERGGTGSSPPLSPWPSCSQVQQLVAAVQQGRKQSSLPRRLLLLAATCPERVVATHSSYCHQAGIAGLSSGQESVLGMQWAQLIHASAEQMSL